MKTSKLMCTKLSNNQLEERLRWVLPIANKEVRLIEVSKVFHGSKRTLERWVSNYKKHGELGLIPKTTKPNNNPNETSIRTKERIIELRKETRLCPVKINYRLKKEGITIGTRTIEKIIKKEGLTRKYRTKKIQCEYVKVMPSLGDLVEIDVKYVPDRLNGIKYYQFTAIDCYSRWRYLKVYDDISSYSAVEFVKELMKVAHFKIKAIKTDNGTCFTNRYVGYAKSKDPLIPRLHALDIFCQRHNIIHYLIDPGKPAQNGKVERSHRTDQEHFYDVNRFKNASDLEKKIKIWNDYYNNLEHISLKGKTPNETVLESLNKYNSKPPYVCS